MERLLCIINTMNIGGAETFLMKVYRKLDKHRYQMDFCVNVFEKNAYEEEILSMGGKVYKIPSKTKNAQQFKKQLFSIIKENRYQNVLRVTSNAAGFWDLKIAKKAGAQHTIVRSSNADDNNFKQRLIHKACKVLWGKYVDVKAAPSDLAAIYTFGKKAYQNGEVTMLHNGLDLSLYRFDINARTKIRNEFNVKASTALLGHIGRFNPQKNHGFLLELFAKYHSKNPDSALLLTGAGDLENEIKAKIKELGLEHCVILSGLRSDIPDILSAVDVFLLPSLYEGMPNTVIEAQACGVPCVVSNTVTREADLSGKVYYAPITDTKPWTEAVENALSGGRIACDMSEYDIDSVINKFTDLCFI